MTPQEEWKLLVWRRWFRITRRRPTANVSADIIVRRGEQRGMADAIDAFEERTTKPKLTQLLFK